MNMKSRDKQTRWIAEIAIQVQKYTKLPICILGSAFKANVSVEEGSSSLLLKHLLEVQGITPELLDPYVKNRLSQIPQNKRVFILATKHDIYKDIKLPAGSVVIDPWRFYQPSKMWR